MDDSNENKPNLTILPVDPEQESARNEKEIEIQYVGGGKTCKEISEDLQLPYKYVRSIIRKNKLSDLRNVYLHKGIKKIQNKQLDQAERMLNVQHRFRWMRLKQLEDMLKEYMAYYERWGDFKLRHPDTLEILYSSNGIPKQLNLPRVTQEINSLKEGFTLSQGLKQLLYQIDDILNKPKPPDRADSPEFEHSDIYDAVFKKKD